MVPKHRGHGCDAARGRGGEGASPDHAAFTVLQLLDGMTFMGQPVRVSREWPRPAYSSPPTQPTVRRGIPDVGQCNMVILQYNIFIYSYHHGILHLKRGLHAAQALRTMCPRRNPQRWPSICSYKARTLLRWPRCTPILHN